MNQITNIKKKILYNYLIHSTYEAGIILEAWEIKSIKKNGFNITGSYVIINERNIVLINSHIKAMRVNKYKEEFNERRKRKLLLSKKEINQLKDNTEKKNMTLMPSIIYWKNNYIKIEINICAGKKKYDKRENKKEKEFKQYIKIDNLFI